MRQATSRAEKLTQNNVRYLMVNLDSPANTPALRQFLQRFSIQGTALKYHFRDPTFTAARKFRVSVFPSVVILDTKGRIVHSIQGSIPSRSLRKLLRPLGARLSH